MLFSVEAITVLRALEGSPDATRRSIARRVHALRSTLLSDCLHGEVVKKDRIPLALRTTYGIRNLYVEDLPAFWRLLYTVGQRRRERYVAVVGIVDHRTYSRWFRWRHP